MLRRYSTGKSKVETVYVVMRVRDCDDGVLIGV
jgi:hypothetical protein